MVSQHNKIFDVYHVNSEDIKDILLCPQNMHYDGDPKPLK